MSASLICGWLGWHWSAANYLVDQDGAAKVRIYETEGVADGDGHYRQSSVSVINEHGRDVTNRFDITISGKAVRAQATAVYLAMVSAMPNQEVGWRAYLQCRCLVTVGRHENRFTEYYQDRVIPSNTVWTRTPDLTPGLHLEKFDAASGFSDGDRDEPNQALPVNGDIDMVFRITNDSGKDPGTGRGALFRARDLRLEDWTVTGSGKVVDLKYPQGWNDLILKPGQSVDVHGTLVGATGHHTNRARVTGKPLTACPVNPPSTMPDHDGSLARTAASSSSGSASGSSGQPAAGPGSVSGKTSGPVAGSITVDGQTLCLDTKVNPTLMIGMRPQQVCRQRVPRSPRL